jgi:hypothetical protein
MKVIKREKKQAIALAVERKCRKYISGGFFRAPARQLLGVPIETRWCVGTVY